MDILNADMAISLSRHIECTHGSFLGFTHSLLAWKFSLVETIVVDIDVQHTEY